MLSQDIKDPRVPAEVFADSYPSAWELIENTARFSRMVKAAATRVERFSKLANQLTRHCDASDDTLANLASDITPLLATLDVAYSNLTKHTKLTFVNPGAACFHRKDDDGIRID